MNQEIIIVHKDSNLALHGHRVQRQVEAGRIDKAQLDDLQIAHREHEQTLTSLRASLDKVGLPYREISRGSPFPQVGPDQLILTVGGDGTILYAGQHLDLGTSHTIIGIRSSSASVGYLCAYSFLNVDKLGNDLRENQVGFQNVHRLVGQIRYADDRDEVKTVPVMNDFLFTNANPAATTRYRIHFGEESEYQKSSGVWISTATGSTAGISAAGGVAMPRESDRAQFRVRELFQPPNERLRIEGGIFDPGATQLIIENHSENAILAFDGQHGSVDLDYGDTVQFETGPSIRLAHPSDD